MSARTTIRILLTVTLAATWLAACAPPPPPPRPTDGPPVDASLAIKRGCNTDDRNDVYVAGPIDPEWVRVKDANDPNTPPDPNHPNQAFDPMTIMEGTIAPLANEKADNQAPSEVAEEDIPWNHYTHDKTSNVIPDPGYHHLLATHLYKDKQGNVVRGGRPDLEVEWDNGSRMDRPWGAFPEFVWPSVHDRVWVEGSWVFDCGHGGDNPDLRFVSYDTEIHPPRAVVTFRLNRGAILPINGSPQWAPVTTADVFVSGNGGGAIDRCNLITRHISVQNLHVDDCVHTGPFSPVNDRNYVFDIYPTGTDYTTYEQSLAFHVTPPSANATLQAKVTDKLSEVNLIACGLNPCKTVQPLLCPVDAATPPPTQQEVACPAAPAHPTHMRVILPFKGSSANIFAQEIQVGWTVAQTNPVRTFKITLHRFSVYHNGENWPLNGDWRVFVDVGGQWRYMSDAALYDRDQNGNNACHGDPLTNNGDGDCYQFDGHPWIVNVWNYQPIHIAVGGFESDAVDSEFCRNSSGSGCDPGVVKAGALFLENGDRIGTLEFDLDPGRAYEVAKDVTTDVAHPDRFTFTTPQVSGDKMNYGVVFTVLEIPNHGLVPPPPPGPTATLGPPGQLSVTPSAADVACAVTPQYPPITVSNTGGQALTWQATTDDPSKAVTVTPASGTLAAGQSQTVMVGGRPVGSEVTVTFTSSNGSARTVFTCIVG